VLPRDGTRPPHLISFSVARAGIARLETAAPIAGAVSQIVMVTISSPTNSFAPKTHAPTLVMPAHGRNRSGAPPKRSDASPAQRVTYDVDVGRPPIDSSAQAVSVRITYLIVPGT
jgi:hypothetical protein